MSENETISLPNPFAAAALAGLPPDSADLEGLEREMSTKQEKQPNFPSIYPLFYHSISTEIPQNYHFVIKMAYLAARSFTFFCIFQFFGSFLTFSFENAEISPISNIVLSFSLLVVLPALLFYVQYYPLYCALRDDDCRAEKLIYVQIYVIFVQILIMIGIPDTGCIGIWWTIVAETFAPGFVVFCGTVFCTWEVFNITLQILVLIKMKPIIEGKGRIANPADI